MASMTEEDSSDRSPFFDGSDYHHWKKEMRMFLKSQGNEVVQVTFFGISPDATRATAKKLESANCWAMNCLFSAISNEQLDKVYSCESAKEIWDTLGQIYEGDANDKEAMIKEFQDQLTKYEMLLDEKTAKHKEEIKSLKQRIKELEEKIDDQTGKYEDILKVMEQETMKEKAKTPARRQGFQGRCYQCEKLGHMARYCRRKPKQEENTSNHKLHNWFHPLISMKQYFLCGNT